MDSKRNQQRKTGGASIMSAILNNSNSSVAKNIETSIKYEVVNEEDFVETVATDVVSEDAVTEAEEAIVTEDEICEDVCENIVDTTEFTTMIADLQQMSIQDKDTINELEIKLNKVTEAISTYVQRNNELESRVKQYEELFANFSALEAVNAELTAKNAELQSTIEQMSVVQEEVISEDFQVADLDKLNSYIELLLSYCGGVTREQLDESLTNNIPLNKITGKTVLII